VIRFPHPLITTTLHLFIALFLLLVSTIAIKLLRLFIRSSSGHRLLSSGSSSQAKESIFKQVSSIKNEEITREEQSIFSLTPLALSSALAAVLASLIETQAIKITEAPFWAVARLLPLLITLSISFVFPISLLPTSLQSLPISQKLMVVGLFAILVGGEGKSIHAGGESWKLGIMYAMSVSGWIIAAKAGIEETKSSKQYVDLPRIIRDSLLKFLNRLIDNPRPYCGTLFYPLSFSWYRYSCQVKLSPPIHQAISLSSQKLDFGYKR
jgi:hypothetical protein